MNTINAFELMKSASMLNYLPEFKLPARNSLDQLCIDGGGWIGKDNANNIGKRFVSDLTKSTFSDRAHPERYKKSNSEKLQNYYKIPINYSTLNHHGWKPQICLA
ncbi:unnamed protein product [Rhizophagus irregularis]|nr:unnamed protein product [Rhizophagus irregularis]